eukprot:TRINITY_DN11750_c0_g1_i1.p1 TRINITY_DN11750_c0_g1~~TRINITY_DN11750_c0_g1_i1.p1  ORF type:complete len:194 (-),score=54.09 TRINITY_DN11750_c0_g1_i1:331-912(-)
MVSFRLLWMTFGISLLWKTWRRSQRPSTPENAPGDVKGDDEGHDLELPEGDGDPDDADGVRLNSPNLNAGGSRGKRQKPEIRELTWWEKFISSPIVAFSLIGPAMLYAWYSGELDELVVVKLLGLQRYPGNKRPATAPPKPQAPTAEKAAPDAPKLNAKELKELKESVVGPPDPNAQAKKKNPPMAKRKTKPR